MSPNPKRYRAYFSLKGELLEKSRESALSAIQIFNTPTLKFKAETFIILMIISWTYLLHAYYQGKKIEYRRYELHGMRKRFTHTHYGAFQYWSLDECLNSPSCPLDSATKANLKFIIGLRNEVAHHMPPRIEEAYGGRFHACCLNYNEYLKKLFGEEYGIDQMLSFAIQLTNISLEQARELDTYKFPTAVIKFINNFDNTLSQDIYNNQHYARRLLFTDKFTNAKGKADKVIQFIPSNSELAKMVNKAEFTHVVIKERQKDMYFVKDILDKVHQLGFLDFNKTKHTELWKSLDAKNPTKNFGYQAHSLWYWNDSWLDVVIDYCKKHEKITRIN